MAQPGSNLVIETRSVIEATDRLRAALLDYRTVCEALIRTGGGTDTLESMERIEFRARRQAVNDAIDDFEAARHRFRMELVVVALDEGRNLSDFARALGISRQLASRIGMEVKEKKR